MKIKISILLLAVLFFSFIFFTFFAHAQLNTKVLWQKVEQAQADGLPKTAVKELKKIYSIALKEKKYGEALKAITMQIINEVRIEGNKPEVKVRRMKEELKKAPPEMQPLMKAILANWYWDYYLNNSYRFLDRTRTQGLSEEDFTTWDLSKIFNEISALYQDILKKDVQLKKINISKFSDFLNMGNLPLKLRPTLFDFIAFKAIEFYSSPEQAGVLPEDAFEINVNSSAFAGADDFLKYKPETADITSPKYHAIIIFQKLLEFHKFDKDSDAFIDADINRLNYVYNNSFGDNKNSIYIKRLEEIMKRYPSSEIIPLAYYYWGKTIYSKGDYIEAYKIAEKGRKLFPESPGGLRCALLINTINAKEMSIHNESVVPSESSSKIKMSYRNIDTITFRVIREDLKKYVESGKSAGYLSQKEIRGLLAEKPEKEWTVALKPTKDFKTKAIEIELPKFKKGFYRIFASYKKDFSENNNCIEYSSFFASELAVVTRVRNGIFEGFVLDNMSGNPVKGAVIKIYGIVDRKEWKYGLLDTLKTDENGFFIYSSKSKGYDEREVRVYASDNKGSEFFSPVPKYIYMLHEKEKSLKEVVFFTDRAIYRPGQTIYFKGICIEADREKNKYKVIPDLPVTVCFFDANNQKISKLNLTSNDFGSFSGNFTAPSGRLTGEMTIKTDYPQGYTQIRVEEYKRPRFKVEIKVPEEGFKLNDLVKLTGEAISYTGASIDNATVSYRVAREVVMPYWCFWYRLPKTESQEISHGLTRTGLDGKFIIAFTSKPDNSVSKDLSPYFIYRVYVDVTDSTGETISFQKEVKIGYVAMEVKMNVDKCSFVDKPVKIDISTTTLDGKPLPAAGTVEIFELKEPSKPVRAEILEEAVKEDTENTSRWELWPCGKLIKKIEFKTDKNGADIVNLNFNAGAYKAVLESNDRYGNPVKAVLPFIVINPYAVKFNMNVPSYYTVISDVVEVGYNFQAFWGTGYEKGRAFIEIIHDGKYLKRYWTEQSKTQEKIVIPAEEKFRGGFTVLVTFIKENRLYTYRTDVKVPWLNKKLDIKFLTFRSKLEPGQKDSWIVKIKGPDAERIAAEFVAALYDESLDAFISQRWPGFLSFFRQDSLSLSQDFSNKALYFNDFISNWNPHINVPDLIYIGFPEYITMHYYGERSFMKVESMCVDKTAGKSGEKKAESAKPKNGGDKASPKNVDLSKISSRKNLNETAFFYPQLIADKDGTVNITFKMPDALTRWHFMGFAHTQDLKSGFIEGHAVTQKDLMVQPNPPRFLREGDEIEFSVKVTNMIEKEVKGKVRLTFFQPDKGRTIDGLLKNVNIDQDVVIPAKQSRGYYWKINVPDNLEFIAFKAVASAGNKEDGEEGLIPIISRRIFVTESIPLWVTGPASKLFTFKSLLESSKSGTLENKRFVVQVASNPAWYAVQALPYLTEFPYECSEQVFNRFYANSLAGFIANSDPKIKKIFGEWKGTDALKSVLEKNEDLKNCLLIESPWVMDAKNESQAKKNIGLLFDEKHINSEIKSAIEKLSEMQLNDGSLPWFPGGPGNSYITLYIMTGFGKLKQIGVQGIDYSVALKAVDYTDGWINEVYREILKYGHLNENHLSTTIAFYLYGRSFYLKDKPISQKHKEAVDYFLSQGRKYWKSLPIMSQGHLAIALKRFGDVKTSKKIMASLKERSKASEEMGMFWEGNEFSWWWYQFPVETQSVMIAAFDEVADDLKSVEGCKIWLLKQKQTTSWRTTTATADAVYALLCRGENLLSDDEVTEIVVGGQEIKPEKVEAGTGFYEKIFNGREVKPQFGNITMKKNKKGISWGGAYWQYMEDISKVKIHTQTPLKLKKTIFVKRHTKAGPVIEPLKGTLEVGDLIVVRIELRADRDMEFIHLKDQRGSGLEPVNVLSQYKHQDGLWYYESTKDTATHFFIDYLAKGTYVFEYPLRVINRGKYQSGIATIQCMYAPEFSSHSGSMLLEVR